MHSYRRDVPSEETPFKPGTRLCLAVPPQSAPGGLLCAEPMAAPFSAPRPARSRRSPVVVRCACIDGPQQFPIRRLRPAGTPSNSKHRARPAAEKTTCVSKQVKVWAILTPLRGWGQRSNLYTPGLRHGASVCRPLKRAGRWVSGPRPTRPLIARVLRFAQER